MKFLKSLQQKTEGEKDRFILVAALCIMSLIIIAWLGFETFFVSHNNEQNSGTYEKMKEQIISGWQKIQMQ